MQELKAKLWGVFFLVVGLIALTTGFQEGRTGYIKVPLRGRGGGAYSREVAKGSAEYNRIAAGRVIGGTVMIILGVFGLVSADDEDEEPKKRQNQSRL